MADIAPYVAEFTCNLSKEQVAAPLPDDDGFSMFRSKDHFVAWVFFFVCLVLFGICVKSSFFTDDFLIHTSLKNKLHTNLVAKMECAQVTGNIFFCLA